MWECGKRKHCWPVISDASVHSVVWWSLFKAAQVSLSLLHLPYNKNTFGCCAIEVVVTDRESWLLSGMRVNQSRLVQSNLWQETTSLWDTPAVHLYTAQHHKQLNSGGKIYCSCQERNRFPFYNLSGREDHTNAPLFPQYCSLVWISLLSLLLLSVFPPYTHTHRVPWWLRPITTLRRLHNRAQCPQWYHSVPNIPQSSRAQDKQGMVFEVPAQFQLPLHLKLHIQPIKEQHKSMTA